MRMNIRSHENTTYQEKFKLVCVVCNTKLNPQTLEHKCEGRKGDDEIKLCASVNPAK